MAAQYFEDHTPPPEKGWRIPQHSLTRLWVIFRDRPKPCIFHGRDWSHDKSSKRSQRLGVIRFERYLEKVRGNWIKARIYCSITNETLHEYENGSKIL